MDTATEIVCSSPVGSIIEVPSEPGHCDSSVVELPLESAQLLSFRLESAQRNSEPVPTQETFDVDIIDSGSSCQSSYEVFSTAREKEVVTVPFKGLVDVHDGIGYEAKVVPVDKDIHEISDSEDENDVSIIEITRTSYIQVRSSQQDSLIETQQHEFDPFEDDLPELPDVVPEPEPSMESDSESPLRYHQPSSPELQSSIPPVDLLEETTIPSSSQPDGPFTQLNLNELRQKIIQYGLKPANSKQKMIQSLSQVHSQLSESTRNILSQSQNIKESQILIMTDIYNKMNKDLTDELQLKIATFQPIHKSDISYLINDDVILKNWCDWNSISLIEDTS